ncbi:hypothetical protein FA95DRAFT_1492812 [Auriscalpium vulgare]|uniref:Uncharacterized protein n=1 Tax=Auriscalpium vulgare TaxID=40419 RepID=A0ACB8RUE7_9AGAM|nr:hypothetical protein FA95DRAFT_1492812 [Auriscalpium vulgare]
MAAYVTVNGVKAYALFDTGSTTVSVTPDFARVSRIPLTVLDNPVTLQLGCVGSRSKINFGASVQIEVGSVRELQYVDVVNTDRYDMIVGTPFMYRFGVCLDFGRRAISIQGELLELLPDSDQLASARRRTGAAVQDKRSTH